MKRGEFSAVNAVSTKPSLGMMVAVYQFTMMIHGETSPLESDRKWSDKEEADNNCERKLSEFTCHLSQ